MYERAGGANAIYDTAVEAGLARNNMRNVTTRTSTGPLTPSATADFDTDGIAMRQEDGACPDDTMAAGSPYREGETLRRAKRGDDACLVVYIVDGGANDEDGLANGVIKDPLGIRAGNAAGSRRTGGAFGPATLTALGALTALLLPALRSRRRQRR